MADDINSRKALVAYLRTLLSELETIGEGYDRNKAFLESIDGWYNLTLRDFLEAMAAAIDDNSRGEWPGPDDPSVWRAIAQAVSAGKGYE